LDSRHLHMKEATYESQAYLQNPISKRLSHRRWIWAGRHC
jgi:hypothetical protein